jgi:hypothetical protein
MSDVLSCSFCEKTSKEVRKLVSAKTSLICDECVSQCNDLMETNTTDKMELMWKQQEEFMKLLQQNRGFPEFPTDITSKKGQQFLKEIRNHMMEELFEAGQHLKNAKSHRVTDIPEIDREAYKEELVDALHLYFELVIASGISLDELVDAYMKKGDTNFNRISGTY